MLLTIAFLVGTTLSEHKWTISRKRRSVDWLGSKLTIERRIVAQQIDDVKTAGSRKAMVIDTDLMEVLKHWKQSTKFGSESDWIFASPIQRFNLEGCLTVTVGFGVNCNVLPKRQVLVLWALMRSGIPTGHGWMQLALR